MLIYDFWILDIFWKLIIQFDHTLDPIHGVYIGKFFQGLTTDLCVVMHGSCHEDIV